MCLILEAINYLAMWSHSYELKLEAINCFYLAIVEGTRRYQDSVKDKSSGLCQKQIDKRPDIDIKPT